MDRWVPSPPYLLFASPAPHTPHTHILPYTRACPTHLLPPCPLHTLLHAFTSHVLFCSNIPSSLHLLQSSQPSFFTLYPASTALCLVTSPPAFSSALYTAPYLPEEKEGRGKRGRLPMHVYAYIFLYISTKNHLLAEAG